MPADHPQIKTNTPLSGAERQARHRERGRDAIVRLDAARRVVERADEAARLCGDVEVAAAWAALCAILNDQESG